MADRYKRNVGRAIKKLRLNKGWTQHELANAIGDPKVNSQRVSEWERGINLPQKHLPALAKALGVSENHILAGEPEKDAAAPSDASLLAEFSAADPRLMAGRLDRIEVEVTEMASAMREIRALLKGQIRRELGPEVFDELEAEARAEEELLEQDLEDAAQQVETSGARSGESGRESGNR